MVAKAALLRRYRGEFPAAYVDPDWVNDYLVRRLSIAVTPKECIERVEALKAAGGEHLMLTPARKVYDESVEAFAKKVIPNFR